MKNNHIDNFIKFDKKPSWLNIESPQIRNFDLIIGFDTEYFSDTKSKLVNNLLSYPFSSYLLTSEEKTSKISLDEGKYFEKIVYSNNDFKRETLPHLLRDLLIDLDVSHYKIEKKLIPNKNNKIRYKYFKVLIVSHFSKAEWQMLAHRSSLAQHLIEIQGTLSSFKPFKLTINYKGRNEQIDVLWQDTVLFADPREGRGLDNLSKSTSHRKISIPKPWSIEKMDILLKENKDLYEKYAIQDARVTLEYYCSFMNEFNSLSHVVESPLTIGDGTVKWFLKFCEEKSIRENKIDKNGKLDKKWYEKKILGIEFTKGKYRQSTINRIVDEYFANNTFYGGLNTSYKLGKFKKKDWFIFDLDFSNAYATSLSVIPSIDWNRKSEKIFDLKEFLDAEAFKQQKYINIGTFLLNGFSFPDNVFQTSIAIPDDAGLIYVKETDRKVFCTYPELITSIKLGMITDFDQIDSRIFYNIFSNDVVGPLSDVLLAFNDFIKFVVQQRKQWPKGTMRNLIYKLFSNAFYGKLGQGIFDRYVYNLLGQKKEIHKSKITVPHYASSCTSLVRTALIDVVNYLQSLENAEVLSATTDGCMVAIHKSLWKRDLKFKVVNGIVKVDEIDILDVVPDIYKDLSTHYSIRFLIQGRKNLGLDENWLEIKHVGDESYTWKTRLNAIIYQGVEQHIAKGGMNKIYADTLEKLLKIDQGDYIGTIENNSLVSTKEMLKYECDLVQKKYLTEHYKEKKKVNLDYDYKRFVLEDRSSTRTFKNIKEWEYHRNIAKNLRRLGKRSTYEMIELSKKANWGERVRIQGSLPQTISRLFLNVLLNSEVNFLPQKQTYKQIVDILEVWRKENYSNNKEEKKREWKFSEELLWNIRRSKLQQRVLPNTPKITSQIISMSKTLNISQEKQQEILKILLR